MSGIELVDTFGTSYEQIREIADQIYDVLEQESDTDPAVIYFALGAIQACYLKRMVEMAGDCAYDLAHDIDTNLLNIVRGTPV